MLARFPVRGTTKTSRQRKKRPHVTFYRFSEVHFFCPYKTLKHLELSKVWRKKSDKNQLLPSYMELNRPVSTATVGRWIKKVLGLAGIDNLNLQSSSVTAAITSKTKAMSLSTKDILKWGTVPGNLLGEKNIESTLYLMHKSSPERVTGVAL